MNEQARTPKIIETYEELVTKIAEKSYFIEIQANREETIEITRDEFLSKLDNYETVGQSNTPQVEDVLTKNQRSIILEAMGIVYDERVSKIAQRHLGSFKTSAPTAKDSNATQVLHCIEVFEAETLNALSVNIINTNATSAKTMPGAHLMTAEECAKLSETDKKMKEALEALGFESYVVGNTSVIEKSLVEENITIGVFITSIACSNPMFGTDESFLRFLTDVSASENNPESDVRTTVSFIETYLKVVHDNMNTPVRIQSDCAMLTNDATKDSAEPEKTPVSRIICMKPDGAFVFLASSGTRISQNLIATTETITLEAMRGLNDPFINAILDGIPSTPCLLAKTHDAKHNANTLEVFYYEEETGIEFMFKVVDIIAIEHKEDTEVEILPEPPQEVAVTE